MRKGFYKILLFISALTLVCCAAGTAAFAAQPRWFVKDDLKNNNAAVVSWIKLTAAGADGFDSDEDYVAEFTVKYWAGKGDYKLVLTGIDFTDPSGIKTPDPDEMWEYYDGVGGKWKPISNAKNLELISVVTLNPDTGSLKLRVKPVLFLNPDYADYLDYYLELTAELLPV